MSRLTTTLTFAALCTFVTALSAQGAAPEVNAWRLAERYRTPEAYARFVAWYPDAPQAAQARAMVLNYKRLDELTANRKLNSLADRPGLKELALQSQSSNLAFPSGTRLIGPGVTTSRAVLAKQHILIPLGEWVPVASIDQQAFLPGRIQVTSAAFGKFDGHVLQELMVVSFPSRIYPAAVQNGGNAGSRELVAWPAAMECESKSQPSLFHLKDSGMYNTWCTTIQGPEAAVLDPGASEIASRTKQALLLLAVDLPTFTHRADTHVTSKDLPFASYTHFYRHSQQRVVLVDELGEGDIALNPDLDADSRAHYKQQAHFAYHAALALNRDYTELILAPEKRLTGSAIFRLLGRMP